MNAIFLNSIVSASSSDARKIQQNTLALPLTGDSCRAWIWTMGKMFSMHPGSSVQHEEISPSDAGCNPHSSSPAVNILENKTSTIFFLTLRPLCSQLTKISMELLELSQIKHWQLVQ